MAFKSFALLCLLQASRAAIYSAEMTTMECFGATQTADGDPKVYNGQYCLEPNSWTAAGKCCNILTNPPTANTKCAESPQWDTVKSEYFEQKAFCGTKKTISNRFLRAFLLPADTTHCPTTYGFEQVTEANKTFTHTFNIESPTTVANTWHCKYGLTSSDKIKTTDPIADRGYMYLIAEGSGFDNDIIIIVQPRGEYLDFNF